MIQTTSTTEKAESSQNALKRFFDSLVGSQCDPAVRAARHAEAVAAAKARLSAGERLFAIECGGGYSFGSPTAWWATNIARHQLARRNADIAAVARLAVGESRECVRGFHPRHGEAVTTVTRIA